MRKYSGADLAGTIDHTVLKPDTQKEAVRQLCKEAKEYGFASVCVNPYYTKLVAEELKGSDVKVCCVISFPFGADPTPVKAFAAQQARTDGAQEIDMVINVGALKDGNDGYVEADIRAVVEAAKPAAVKVILETCLLTDDEKKRACEACVRAGAAFVKTSTGFSSGGATVEDIQLMRETVGPEIGVKASGGIRTYADAEAMLDAGASRIGASAGLAIMRE